MVGILWQLGALVFFQFGALDLVLRPRALLFIILEYVSHITKYQADKCWAWVRKHMGLDNEPDYCIHSCRHTCASRLVNAGVDLYVVKEWLGHSSIKITERYAHLDPEKLATAMQHLEVIK